MRTKTPALGTEREVPAQKAQPHPPTIQYDAFGRRRVRKEYGWSGSAWTLTNELRYVYDGMLVVQERDGNNLALVSYTRGNDLSGSRQGAGGIGGLLARTDHALLNATGPSPSAHAYYHCDGNGNITALVDTNGFIVARYQYDPYGNLLGMAGPLAEANTYRFSSKDWHANAGLYYYGFRYYEPNLQRWLNQDPIEEAGGINLYEFAFSSPLNWFDAFGWDGCSYNELRDDPDLADEDPLTEGARNVRDKSYRDAKNFAATAENLANLHPVVGGYAATGTDAMGRPVSGQEQVLAAAGIVPVGKVGGLLGKLGARIGRFLWPRHHVMPSAFLKRLPDDVRKAVQGRRGDPNRWPIPKELHDKIHDQNRGFPGGPYNKFFDDKLKGLEEGVQPTVDQVLKWKDEAIDHFGLRPYCPK